MELCECGSLQDCVRQRGPLDATTAAAVLREVLHGLRYLHLSRLTIHRDIKGANVLLTAAGSVRLADFGVSAVLDGVNEQKTVIGTPHWMAPEVIDGSGHGTSADVWSVGVMAIELSTGVPPLHHVRSQLAVMYRLGSP